jgi:glutaredoxin 2
VIRRLSGQHAVPILVTDSGQVITGSASIVAWAWSHTPRND